MKLRIIYILSVILFLTISANANRCFVVESVFHTCLDKEDIGALNEINFINSIGSTSPFITIWDTELPGMSANNQISIPGIGTNYSISWEEVDSPLNRDSLIGNNTTIITFPNPGVYSVSITPGVGTFHRIQFIDEGDSSKIINIAQWGEIEWSSFAGAFKGCLNLNCNATDLPLLNAVTDMSEMFFGCTELDGPSNMGLWDVSNVINMGFMFGEAISFNQNIGSWDVGNVTTTSLMFYTAISFNQDLSSWNVANAEDMSSMFEEAILFNQDLSSWNVANATNMRGMFAVASSFNGNIGSWDVANVTNMRGMFAEASSFNQDISSWNVGMVTDMRSMFEEASLFNQDIGNWNVAMVTEMRSMFASATSFNQDLGSWNLTNIDEIRSMLDLSGMDCNNYTATLIGWNDNPSTPNELEFGAEGLQYGIEAETARDNLISSNEWTIEGDNPSGVECLTSVGTETTDLDSSVKLFPNPFDNQFVVEFSGDDEQVTIVLYDQLSRKVAQQTVYKSTTIDTEHLPQGLYIYEVKNIHRIISSGKIVKK